MKIIPMVTTPIKVKSSFLSSTLLSIIRDGKDKVVIAIISANIVPAGTDARYNASAIGIAPKISA